MIKEKQKTSGLPTKNLSASLEGGLLHVAAYVYHFLVWD
jgi:hypothetical protein